jgi:hypothetical protein
MTSASDTVRRGALRRHLEIVRQQTAVFCTAAWHDRWRHRSAIDDTICPTRHDLG